jgi:hypothetical protein
MGPSGGIGNDGLTQHYLRGRRAHLQRSLRCGRPEFAVQHKQRGAVDAGRGGGRLPRRSADDRNTHRVQLQYAELPTGLGTRGPRPLVEPQQRRRRNHSGQCVSYHQRGWVLVLADEPRQHRLSSHVRQRAGQPDCRRHHHLPADCLCRRPPSVWHCLHQQSHLRPA